MSPLPAGVYNSLESVLESTVQGILDDAERNLNNGELVEEPGSLGAEMLLEAAGNFSGLAGVTDDGNAGNTYPQRPKSREEWLAELQSVTSLAEMGIRLAWGLKQGFLAEFGECAGPTRLPACKPRSGELFPLPVVLPEMLEECGDEQRAGDRFSLAVRSWVAVACAATNALHQCGRQGFTRKPGKVHVRLLEDMEGKIGRFLKDETVVETSFSETVADLKSKRVSYAGEEVSQPHPLSCEQIIKGLPPVGHGGSIPVTSFLRGWTKYLMENPEESLLELSERGSEPVSAKVHIKKGEELAVFGLLKERGIITWVPEDTAYSDSRGVYLSGLFGVVKQGKFTQSNQPVLRVITNLVPANGLFGVLRGDIDYLPAATGWLPMVLAEGQQVTMSQADMASAFYLFGIPPQWYPYFCLNFKVPGSAIGLDKDKVYRPTIRVLPMGWSSSVGIMQQISREILLSKGLPPSLEYRKSGNLPPWFAQVMDGTSSTTAWWQVYLDNFMSGERTEGEPGQIGLELQQKALAAWESTGVLTAADKQVLAAKQVTELGVRSDGEHKLLGVSQTRLLKTIWSSLYILGGPPWSKKEVQVVLGRWIFVLQFRRAAMSVLSKSWRAVENAWPRPQDRNALLHELMMLICLGPLLQCDLTAEYDHEVTCSDASERGGAVAVSNGLTWSGRSLVAHRNDLRFHSISLPIVVLSCFNGIGGAFRIYDVLGISPMGRIAIDISKPANRVTRTVWPGVLELHDIEQIDRNEVRRWAGLFPRALQLHLYAGFPCVHLSAVRAYRENLEGEGSRLFWKLLDLIDWVYEVFSPFCVVKFCVENVASMDEEARKTISDYLEVAPIKLDPADSMPVSRPRFAWCSVPLYQMQGLELHEEKEYVRAYTHFDTTLQTSQWIRPGWSWNGGGGEVVFPTFMKSIRRRRPPPVPVGYNKATPEMLQMWESDSYRFPPYQYHPKYWLTAPHEPPRLLDSSERELLLGFGPGHTDVCQSAGVKKRNLTEHEDIRKSLAGDSFSILSFAIMGAAMCADMVARMPPERILRRLGLAPGACIHPDLEAPITRWLCYGPQPEAAPNPVEIVKQLGLTVNHTGADVRVSSGQILGHKPPNHASVRSWWWQWKQLFNLRWKESSHINYLEMKMIYHSLLWKCRKPRSVNKRWLHLEDSMVCLLILTKGRTSSLLLQPLSRKIGALQLAMGSVLMHAHVGSEENPTDEASRL